jgi:hypothetical protein
MRSRHIRSFNAFALRTGLAHATLGMGALKIRKEPPKASVLSSGNPHRPQETKNARREESHVLPTTHGKMMVRRSVAQRSEQPSQMGNAVVRIHPTPFQRQADEPPPRSRPVFAFCLEGFLALTASFPVGDLRLATLVVS